MRLGRRDPGVSSRRHGPAIGLDLGATAVRAAAISITRSGERRSVVVDRVGEVDLPPGAVVNGAVADPAAVTTALKLLWRTHDIGGREVVLGVAGPQVQVRQLQVPDLDPVRRAQALPFQAREVVALPLDQVVLDFAPLGAASAETGLVDGLLVASPREPVEQAVAAVEAAGLRVVRVDLASFAVLRSVAQTDMACEAVIDIGAHLTTVVVHRDGVPVMVRTVARGGQEITSRLAERLQVDVAEAEHLKVTEGLQGSGELDDAMHSIVTPLLTDIRTSLNYFRSSNAGTRIEHVALTGGGAMLPGLAGVVSNQVGAPVGTDTAGAVDPGEMHAASALSIGLAIGAAA